jgi:hypothetical protein
MVPILLAASEFEARTLIVGLIVALIAAIVAYLVGVLLTHIGVPIPPQILAGVVFLLVLLVYVLDAIG